MTEQTQLELDGGPATPWRVFTLHQPWASAMITGTPDAGFKDVENRGQPTRWRSRVFIHAGKVLDYPAGRMTPDLAEALKAQGLRVSSVDVPDWAWPAGALENPMILPFGAILGYVTFASCTGPGGWNPSRWARRGAYHYWVRGPHALDVPIPAAGQQNLWTPAVDDARNPGLYKKLADIP